MRYLILTVATVFAVSLVSGQTLATAQTRAAYGQDQQAEKQQSQQTIGQNQQQGRQNGSQQLNSDQVRKLQQALKDKGYNPGQVDGIIGSQTRQALRQFQQSQGIASTGKVNPKTLQALDINSQEFMGLAPQFGEQNQQQYQQQEKTQKQQEYRNTWEQQQKQQGGGSSQSGQ